tara:strand:+ start:3900 stop:4583 length:684 start_codon:yes stop_codon:yes gene_type:complete
MSFYTPHFNPESVEIGRVHNNDNNQRNDELQHINHPYTFHIFIDSDDKELQNKYIKKINSHNAMVDNNPYPDSGFDLFIPTEFSGEYQPHTRTKVDYKVIGMMEYSLSKKIVPYYIYPRSSISKTPLQLCNNVGIIDSGYRGHLMSYFANHNTVLPDSSSTSENAGSNPYIVVNTQTKSNPYVVEPYTRLTQVCNNNLAPFYVKFHNTKDYFTETERADGGFGSTGV